MGPAVEAQAGKVMDAEQQQNQLQDQQCYMEKGVMLEPFVHQVGGHCCLLRLGEQTICKELLPREHRFYKSVPAVLRKFTPQYRGVVSVSCEEDAKGNICLIAHSLQSDPAVDLENTCVETEGSKNDNKDDQSHDSSTDKDRSINRKPEVIYYRLESSHSKDVPQLKHKPWTLKTQQYYLKRMKDRVMNSNQHKFILLEDLTWRHTLPCVLDLKMGTQHYGDEVTEEKAAMKRRQCQNSTSPLIGVYISGMQVYQCDTGQLMFINKYLGRILTLKDFKEALFQFFHSGRRLQHELLSPVLRSLRELQAALEACESYRFYSSSLLIIYDAAAHQKQTEDDLSEEEDGSSDVNQTRLSRSDPQTPVVDVKMIDFAHTACRHYQGESVVHEGPDSSLIFGLQNLIAIISELESRSTDERLTKHTHSDTQ